MTAAVAQALWQDWTWQMRNRIRTARDLERYLAPTPAERAGIEQLADRFHFVITPYYASLMDPRDPACPIRRQVVPNISELDDPAGLADQADTSQRRDGHRPHVDPVRRRQFVGWQRQEQDTVEDGCDQPDV